MSKPLRSTSRPVIFALLTCLFFLLFSLNGFDIIIPGHAKESSNDNLAQPMQVQETPESVKTPTEKPPRPTSTPIPIPPPPVTTNINLMIFFGVIAVLVVLAGVWLNRNRLK